jgi:hypothetical protein
MSTGIRKQRGPSPKEKCVNYINGDTGMSRENDLEISYINQYKGMNMIDFKLIKYRILII